jgi:thiol peroxidase
MNFFFVCNRLEFRGEVSIEPAYPRLRRRIMATTTLGGTPVQTNSDLPATGSAAPDFLLIGTDLSEKTLAGVCQAAARTFNERAANLDNVVVLVISSDLPFAQKRFCVAEGLDGVVPLSTFRSTFLEDYGVKLVESAMKGLAARAIVVLDENNEVVHTELVPDIGQEPNYDAAIAAVS